jgi:hypothetical protein
MDPAEKSKKGKRLATELKNVKVEYVSLVQSGANGERFQVFKSADFKGTEKKHSASGNEVSVEVKTLIESLKDNLNKFLSLIPGVKKKNSNQELSVSETKEIMEGIKGLGEKLTAMSGRLDDLDKKPKKGEGNDPEPTEAEKAAAIKKAAEEKAKADAKKEKSGDEDEDSNEEILGVLKGIGEQVGKIDERVKTIESTRQTSNALAAVLDSQKKKDKKEDVDESADFFKDVIGGNTEDFDETFDKLENSEDEE